jgi:DNA-binding NarL/FixJ family response regulator
MEPAPVARTDPAPVVRIVILYLHPLLGEGLASLLSAEPGIVATAVARSDPGATSQAMLTQPDLIVVEGADRSRLADMPGARSPAAYFRTVDGSGHTLGPRLSDPEAVLDLARGLTRRPAVVPGAG